MTASYHQVGNPSPSDPSAAVYASHHEHGLDYAVWFHAPLRTDDRLRYEQHRIWTGRSRVLCHGSLFDPSGLLVATVAQESFYEAG
jgi:acyl-CoA thioesterase